MKTSSQIYSLAAQSDIQGLLNILQSPEVRERSKLRRTLLGAIRRKELGTESVPLLRILLHDDDWKNRAEAAKLLGAVGGAQAADILTSAARDSNAAARCQVIEAIREIDPVAGVPIFVEALEDSSPIVRNPACRGLAEAKDPSTVNSLAPLLRDPVRHVRSAAAGALGAIGTAEATETLTVAAQDAGLFERRILHAQVGLIERHRRGGR